MFKSKWNSAFALAAVLLLVLAIPALAQDQGAARGNLSGIVYDPTKAVVPGATVTITGPIGSQTQTTTDNGSFLFQALVPGNYGIRVEKSGFRAADVKGAEVLIDKTTSVEIRLQTGEITQVVEVNAASETIDTTSSSVNTGIADTLYQNIPVQRNVASLFYLAPGAVDGQGTGNNNPSISGSTGLENAYVADGVSINDPAFGGLGVWSRSYGALGSGINLSFVKEVQVKTGGFEPQYGHAAGGVVQIVTKSGGTETHGTVGLYYHGKWQQATQKNGDDFGRVNQFGRFLTDPALEGDFELGGYVPGKLRDKLFYFGTFNPSWTDHNVSPASNSPLFTIYNGGLTRKVTSYDYAGKLTFKITDKQTVESSVFGDPSSTNTVPWSTLNALNTTGNSKWDFGTRNWAVRYDGAFGTSWLVDAAFTWSWNHFTETPQFDVTQIVDQTQSACDISASCVPGGQFNAQGFGYLEPYDSNTRSVSADVSKSFHFLGGHTLSVGYTWQFPVYNDIIKETGGKYTIPDTNASGTDPGYGNCPTQPTCGVQVAGEQTDAAFNLQLASTITNAENCSLCPYMAVPGYAEPQQVVLAQTRGRFDGGVTASSGKYHAAYINDMWSLGKHFTANVGLRWEQQRLTGNLSSRVLNDAWSPRAGISWDPKGDRKTKIYANFGRYNFILPLDAAVRELSSEQDLFNMYFAPASTTTGCPTGTPAGASCIATNSDGSPNYSSLLVPDSAHLLNNAVGGIGTPPSPLVSSAEPYQPGLRMEYTDEWVGGIEHQFGNGILVSARYIDRRMKRVIEDEGGISVEQFVALANNGGGLNYFVGNPNGKSDIFVNPNEVQFGVGTFIPDSQQNAASLPAACIDSNGNATPYVAWNVLSPLTANVPSGGAPIVAGSACFPAVNTNTWTDSAGNLLPDCTSKGQSGCAAFGGEFYADGKPDTYKDPVRKYQAMEFEVNKSLSNNWALVANYRVAWLRGNYEGAYRNDNGQADPGISSLFDLTEGQFGLLGAQQGIGFLNTDRRHVVNIYSTYVLPNTFAKGLTFGGGLRIQTGVPLTTLYAQFAYQNPGEVPLYGRGDLGRAPTVATLDLHAEYPLKLSDRFSLKFGFDAFNLFDTKDYTLVDQNGDLGFGVGNQDFKIPGGGGSITGALTAGHFFTYPFTSRFSLRLVF